ncbi:helix-turn-helix transcriptional regulator [Eubacteriaceae bacterium ES3]|nr:helix-turn-helix transcriptional regulator [Eubacteriaceae bacterium ES3]
MKINKSSLDIAMANKKINFRGLSELSNVSTSTLSYINNGKHCRPEIAGKIAKALDMSVENLIEKET